MYIRNYGDYYGDKTKMELIVDKEALELIERTLWAEIVEKANLGGKHLHDDLTACRRQVEGAIEKCIEAEATNAQEDEHAEDND